MALQEAFTPTHDVRPPSGLNPSFGSFLSSVVLVQEFALAPPEGDDWHDDAPMSLRRQGSVRVKVNAVRQMAFSPVGDEFGGDPER